MRFLLIALSGCFLVGCADKFVTDWVKEQESRKEIGSPVKCPNCAYGWGFVLDNERDDDPVYCLWSGPSLSRVELDDDNYFDLKGWDLRFPKDKDDWRGWKSGIDDFSKHLRMLNRYLSPEELSKFCYSEYTYNQSLAKVYQIKGRQREIEAEKKLAQRAKQESEQWLKSWRPEERKKFIAEFGQDAWDRQEGLARERYQQYKIEAAKSPEQRELEKLNKQVKELKNELKRQNK